MKLSSKRSRKNNATVMAQLRDPDEVEPPPPVEGSEAGSTVKKQKAVDSAIAVGEAKRRAECGNDCAAAGLDTTLSACMNLCVSPHLLSR